jgi:uncharacterized protein (TIRG00374 family)
MPAPPNDDEAMAREPLGGSSIKDRLLAGALPKLVASVVIAIGFVWLLTRGGLPLLPKEGVLARVSKPELAGFVACIVICNLLRTYRWVFLLRPIAPNVKSTRVMGIGMIGFSAIFLAPLRMGEIVRPYLLAQDGEVSFMQAAGTLFAERVIDGVMLMAMAATAMSLAPTVSPLPTSLGDIPLPLVTVRAAVYTAALAFVGLFCVMVAFYAARQQARSVTRRLLGFISPRLADWAANTLERIADGLSFLPSRSNLVSFVGFTAVYWATSVFGYYLLLHGTGLPATPTQAASIVGVLGLGAIVPAGPGLFGAYQIAGFSALAMFFPLVQVRSSGVAMVFISYVAQLLLTCLHLVVGFLLLGRRPQSR